MQKLIVCKKYNTKYNIGITSDGEVLAKLDDGRIVECDKVAHMGSIHYRPKFTNKRISARKLNDANVIINNFTLQHYCPF